MRATAAPIPFDGSVLTDYRHVCAFFSSTQEEYDTLLPFVIDGLKRGERAYEDVAKLFGLTTNNVKVRLHRARQALKALIEREQNC